MPSDSSAVERLVFERTRMLASELLAQETELSQLREKLRILLANHVARVRDMPVPTVEERYLSLLSFFNAVEALAGHTR